MAAIKPSSRYASFDCRSSTSSQQSDLSSPTEPQNPSKNVSSLKRLIGGSSGRQRPAPDPAPGSNSSRILARTKSGDVVAAGKKKNEPNFGSMVKKLMEKKSKPKLVVPADFIREDLKKVAPARKGSNFAGLPKKLFQKAVGPAKGRSEIKALSDVKENTRTLGMVLRSERELLHQNKEYEEDIMELRLMLEEKNREVDKLKDLCLKQREEIKALKDAILFPDVMNSQLHELLEKQGSELKQAKQLIPTLQKQVTSLTGQLQCLAEDLAEVKADKCATRLCFNEHISSPRTPVHDQETSNSLEFSSGDPTTPRGSLEEMFLKDLNPCLTPHYLKSKSKEYNEIDYDSPRGELFGNNTEIFSNSFGSNGRRFSRSTGCCQKPSQRSSIRATNKSDDRQFSGILSP
ncbi:hypothetical protein H6P81_014845 [Aristolochia fimbriata]|uniref:Uncharacterized protein n=1 Tax=Aristolochia fimbriata TaxID=158543 RepID=A0AAV7E3L3_ARIFI|nr:hypothetical protein H6P81_014845 [Aristolochia fimbriata]